MRPRFKNCVIIANPASTNYRRALRLAKKLREYFPPDKMQVVDIAKGDVATTRRIIVDVTKTLTEKSLLCVAGGDGTVSMVVNCLLQNPVIPKANQRATILPLWGGNANDLSYMINGPAWKANIRKILTKGKVVAIHPLEVNIRGRQLQDAKLAACYVSFGASAYAVKRVNDIDYHQKQLYRTPGIKLLAETVNALQSISRAKPFSADINGNKQRLYDLILINGSRIAKVYRAPNRLTDRAFFELAISRKHPILLPYFARIMKAMALERNHRTRHALVVHEPTWAQIDGEVIYIPSHTEVNVESHAKPFYVLSTKLKS